MSYSVVASDQKDAPVSRDTDLADALSVAPRVANERGCTVDVIRNDSGDVQQTFHPDSEPQPPAQEPTPADRAAAAKADGVPADKVKEIAETDGPTHSREARPLADQTDPDEMTVEELDKAFGDADGYPKSENKKAKIAFAKKQQK